MKDTVGVSWGLTEEVFDNVISTALHDPCTRMFSAMIAGRYVWRETGRSQKNAK